MKWTAQPLAAFLAGALACSSTTATSKGAGAPAPSSEANRPPPKIQTPDWLPIQAREMLAARMQRHGEERAKAMASAARTEKKEDMLQAFGRLTETCVSCHMTYLQPDEG